VPVLHCSRCEADALERKAAVMYSIDVFFGSGVVGRRKDDAERRVVQALKFRLYVVHPLSTYYVRIGQPLAVRATDAGWFAEPVEPTAKEKEQCQKYIYNTVKLGDTKDVVQLMCNVVTRYDIESVLSIAIIHST
jgi:hypothetical protein